MLAHACCPAAIATLAPTLLRDGLFHADVLAEFNLAVASAHPIDAQSDARGSRGASGPAPRGGKPSVFSFQRQLFETLADLLANPVSGCTADVLAAATWPVLLLQFHAALEGRVRGAHALAATLGYGCGAPTGSRAPLTEAC